MPDLAELVRTITANGADAELRPILDKHQAAAAHRYDTVRADGTRTPEYQQWQLAAAWVRARQELIDELETLASKTTKADRVDAAKLFGIDGIPGDVGSLLVARRDAGDRVKAAQESRELQEILTRATRTGDEVLARAVAEEAVERLDGKTLNQYVADRPDTEKPLERIWAAKLAGDRSFLLVAAADHRPTELTGMTSYDIERLASAEPTTPAPRAQLPSSGLYMENGRL